MSTPNEPAGTNVVPLRATNEEPTSRKALSSIWGNKVADHGYLAVPHVMLAMQARMGLNPTQTLVLLHLLDYWRHVDRPPFPAVPRLAVRVGLKERQLQRVLRDLEDGGFLTRNRRTLLKGGQTSNSFDLTGLVSKVIALEPEYRSAMREAQKRKAEAETPRKLRAKKEHA